MKDLTRYNEDELACIYIDDFMHCLYKLTSKELVAHATSRYKVTNNQLNSLLHTQYYLQNGAVL